MSLTALVSHVKRRFPSSNAYIVRSLRPSAGVLFMLAWMYLPVCGIGVALGDMFLSHCLCLPAASNHNSWLRPSMASDSQAAILASLSMCWLSNSRTVSHFPGCISGPLWRTRDVH